MMSSCSNDCDRGGSTRSRCSRAAAVESVDLQRVSSTAPCTREKVPGSPPTTVPPFPVTSLENRSGYCEEKLWGFSNFEKKNLESMDNLKLINIIGKILKRQRNSNILSVFFKKT